MRNYTTQMDAARKGILTPEIETVAKKEHMPVEKMMQLVAEGKVAGRCRKYAPYQDQCQLRRFPRLQRL